MVVSAPFFHFSLYTRPSVQNSSLLEHTPTHQNAFLSSAREKEDPFFYRRLLDVVVVHDDEQSRLFLLKLFSRSCSRWKRERERELSNGDWRRCCADESPERWWSGAFTHSRDGKCDGNHRWGDRPVRAPVRHRAHFTVRSFLFFYVYSNNKRDETMRSSRRFEFDWIPIVAAFWHEHPTFSLTLSLSHYIFISNNIQHRNIVATVNLDCKLDLKTIAFHARNVEYNPKVCRAVGGVQFWPLSRSRNWRRK